MNANKYQLSKKVEEIPEALSIYINQIVYSEKRKGIDITTLSLGESYFDIPMYSFADINFDNGYHYSDSMGLPELREQIKKYYNKQYGSTIDSIDNIMVSSGSKIIIYMILQTLLNSGDCALIHEPAWLSYQEQVKLAGAVPEFIPYYCKVKEFTDYFTDNTKLLILNNPNNPAGWTYSEEDLRFLYKECKERGIWILMDEAYSDFVLDKNKYCSLAKAVPNLEGVFIVNSLSKNMGMSGWRVGYVIAERELLKKVLKLNQHLITCAPTILQMYLAKYFDEIIAVTLPQVREVVNKRASIVNYLDSIGLKHLEGDSTFYIFIDVSEVKSNVMDFCLFLLFKYGIATVPGKAYGKSTEKFIRVGIGAESEERIYYALDIIKTVISQNLTSSEYVTNKLIKNEYYRFED